MVSDADNISPLSVSGTPQFSSFLYIKGGEILGKLLVDAFGFPPAN